MKKYQGEFEWLVRMLGPPFEGLVTRGYDWNENLYRSAHFQEGDSLMRILRLVLILVVIAAIGAGGWWYFFARDGNKSHFRTAVAERGELLATINATGTVEAEENIDIGAQVQGMIKKFGEDPKNPNTRIDYGSGVGKATVLAQIDPSLYPATPHQAHAKL